MLAIETLDPDPELDSVLPTLQISRDSEFFIKQGDRGQHTRVLLQIRGAGGGEHSQEAERTDGGLRLYTVQQDQPRRQGHSGDQCQALPGPAHCCRLGRPQGGF